VEYILSKTNAKQEVMKPRILLWAFMPVTLDGTYVALQVLSESDLCLDCCDDYHTKLNY
jgi:hypothetical protein